jgi:aldehyde dehydrogenase (NAD+)
MAAKEAGIFESFVPMEARAQPIYDELKTTFHSGKTKSLEWRKSQLRGIQAMIKENYQEFVDALRNDLGGGELRGLMEMGLIHECEYMINNLDEWAADEHVPSRPPKTEKDKWIVRKEPKGVVFIMGAWNFQLALSVHPLIDVIAAGNCAVLKPSELSPHSALLLERLIHKYLDTSAIRVVQGEIPETTALLTLPWAHIVYTGSTMVGKIVMSAAAKNLVPVTLELGGKSPVIVDKTADIKKAAEKIVLAKMSNAGQWCVNADYVVVDKTVEQQLLDELVKFSSEVLGTVSDQKGDGSVGNYFMRIVNVRNAERMKRIIATSGGDVVCGSVEDCDIEEKFIPFTVISNPNLNSEVMTDEIFGPVLPVVGVDSVDAAIEVVRKVDPTPLALYVYTQDEIAAEKVLTSCTSGCAAVNTCNEQMLNVECTFGGIGTSGMGAYHGKTGFLEFSHKRTILYRDPEGYLIPKALWPKSNKIDKAVIENVKKGYGLLD